MRKLNIIGSGISGLSFANLAKENLEVEIFEANQLPGGMIACTKENGNLYHRVGGHVFNSKNNEVLDWFWGFFNKDKEFIKASRKSKINFYGKTLGYPVENYIYEMTEDIGESIIKDLLQISKKDKEANNFEDFLKNKFGETLYKIYFKPYNQKIWHTDLKNIPLEWLDGKLPMPNVENIIFSNFYRKEEKAFVHANFYYPKHNGSQFIVDRLAEGLKINTNHPITEIKPDKGKVIINETYESEYLIYTGDIRKLGTYLETDNKKLLSLLDKAKNFLSNDTSNALCYTDKTDASWLYIPDPAFKAHRIIYTGNFSENNNANKERLTCTVEFSGNYPIEEMKKEIDKLPGNLEPIAFNYQDPSYVIQNFDTRETIQEIKCELEKDNIFLVGRFAEWEYFNMDKCIESSMETLNRIKNA